MNKSIRTQQLYYKDAYTVSFEARVLSFQVSGENAPDTEDNKCVCEIVLDRTCFFPEGGGQEGDRGCLYAADGTGADVVLRVRDARLTDGVITHIAEAVSGDGAPASADTVPDLFRPGLSVKGEIDWETRFDRMQNHTGEHILSGIVCGTFGYDNVGFRLSDDHMTMDYSGVLVPEQLPEIEQRANEAIWSNLPVIVSFPSEEAQETLQYRSKKEIVGEALRLVEIPGIDVCACCAPHVKTTGETGLLKITRLQNWKGGVRLSVVCGGRALRLFAQEHDMVSALAKTLSTSWENIPDRFDRMKGDLAAHKKELKELKKRYGVTVPGEGRPVRA